MSAGRISPPLSNTLTVSAYGRRKQSTMATTNAATLGAGKRRQVSDRQERKPLGAVTADFCHKRPAIGLRETRRLIDYNPRILPTVSWNSLVAS